MARSGEGAGGGRRGRWMDRHTDPNRFALLGGGCVDKVTFDSMNPNLKFKNKKKWVGGYSN